MCPRSARSRLAAFALGAIFAAGPLLAADGAVEAAATPKAAAAAEAERLRAELLAKMAEINARQRELLEQMQAVDQRRRELELIIARVENLEQYRAGQTPASQTPAGPDASSPPPEVGAERKAEQDAQRDKVPELPRVSADVGGVLTPKGSLVVEPSVQYVYSSTQRVSIEGFTILPALVIGAIDVREADRESLIGSLTARYGVTNRLEAEFRAPYVYRRDSTRTRRILDTSVDESTFTGTASDLGDMEFDLRYQLPRPSLNWPYLVANVRTKFPTGTDPFDIQKKAEASGSPESFDELPTGSGFWSVNPGLTYIYPSDPVVFFGNFGYLWTLKDRKGGNFGEVDPGDAVRMSFGMGFSLNDRSSFSLSYSLDLFDRTTIEILDQQTDFFNKQKIAGSDVIVGKLLIGYSLRLPGGQPLNLAIGIGATDDAPDTDVTFRLPFTVLKQ